MFPISYANTSYRATSSSCYTELLQLPEIEGLMMYSGWFRRLPKVTWGANFG